MSRWAPASDAPTIARGSLQTCVPGRPVVVGGRRRAARERRAQLVGDGDVDQRVERVLALLGGDVADPTAGVARRSRRRTSRRSPAPPTWRGAPMLRRAGGQLRELARGASGSANAAIFSCRRSVHDLAQPSNMSSTKPAWNEKRAFDVDRHRQADDLAAARRGRDRRARAWPGSRRGCVPLGLITFQLSGR